MTTRISESASAPQGARLLRTGDSGFDLVLSRRDCGLRVRSDAPLSVLIVGGPGCGKSTCALQMAHDYVSANRSFCIYQALEEPAEVIKDRVGRLFPKTPVAIRTAVQLKSETESGIERLIATSDGMIVITDFRFAKRGQLSLPGIATPAVSYPVAIGKLADLLAGYQQLVPAEKKPAIMVVDSLNALIARASERGPDVERNLLLSLTELPEHESFIGIFVHESGNRIDVEQYLVDVVIELGITDPPGESRYVRVAKARDHDSVPIMHDMSIEDRGGVKVYPRLALLLDEAKAVQPAELHGYLGLGMSGLDSDMARIRGDAGSEGIPRGSAVLVLGTPHSGKSLIGASFLSKTDRTRDCLCIDFAPGGAGSRIVSGILRSAAVSPEEVMLPVDVRQLRVSETARRLRDKFEAYAGKDKRYPERVLVRDLRYVFDAYSQRDAVDLVAYLLRLAKNVGSTSTVLCTAEKPQDVLDGELWDVFPNIIVTMIVRPQGSPHDCRAVIVRKVDGSTADCPMRQIHLAPDNLQVTDRRGPFAHLTRLATGQYGLGPLVVKYYRQGTSALTEFWNSLRAAVGGSEVSTLPGPEASAEPAFLPFSSISETFHTPESALEHVYSMPRVARSGFSEILMFDEFWANELIESDLLLRLDELDPDLDIRKIIAQFPAETDDRMVAPVKIGSHVYGLPIYANMSVLAYSREALSAAVNSLPAEQRRIVDKTTGIIHENVSWEDVFNICVAVTQTAGAQASEQKGRFFHETSSPESKSTSLLEVLGALGVFDARAGSFDLGRLEDPKWLDEFEWWIDSYFGVRAMSGSGEEQRPAETLPVGSVVFARMWYTQFLQHRRDQGGRGWESEQAGDWSALPLPGTCRALHRGDASPLSFVGDWYLGILDGSLNPHWAAANMIEMCSPWASSQLWRYCAAIPPNRAYWREEGGLPSHVMAIRRHCVTRRSIRNYRMITGALSSTWERLMEGDRQKLPAIRQIIHELTTDLRAGLGEHGDRSASGAN